MASVRPIRATTLPADRVRPARAIVPARSGGTRGRQVPWNLAPAIAEIRVHVPRHKFFVKASSKSFEESFDCALDSLVSQIKRKKQKQAA